MTRLIVGLGNPGQDYAGTRHNAGFEVLEYLARDRGVELFRSARQLADRAGPSPGLPSGAPASPAGAFLWTYLEDLDALLVQPQTFMNHSGRAVASLARWLWPSQFSQVDAGADRICWSSTTISTCHRRSCAFAPTGGRVGTTACAPSLNTSRPTCFRA